jgi:hypothetical protein
VDANFKLKGKKRGLKDVELMPGWGPFVEENAYQDFLVDYVDQPEVSFSSQLSSKPMSMLHQLDQYVRSGA